MKQLKIMVLTAALVFFTTFSAFSQTHSLDLTALQKQVGAFSDSLARSLPFNSTLGLNWSDAYIGKFPHFGAGGMFGITTLDFDAFDEILAIFDLSMPELPTMFFPGYAVEARLGGFFLPFDIGLKFGMLPQYKLGSADKKMDYTLIGGEIRYAVLDGKKNPILPNVSIGVGVNYISGSLAVAGSSSQFGFTDPLSISHSLDLTDPTVTLLWKTTSFDLKAQISKSFKIVTPYLGFGATHAWSHAGYTVDAPLTFDGHALTDADKALIAQYLGDQGESSPDLSGDNLSSITKINGWGFRLFGGTSFNLAVIRLDLTGMYNFLDKMYGISFGVRFQI
jgi:hypothetical protein